MAKYSTGNSLDSDGTCQICGAEDRTLVNVKTEGTIITVCRDCKSNEMEEVSNDDPTETASDQPSNDTPGYSIMRTDSDWVENTDYGNTRTPRLKNGYDEEFKDELKSRDISVEDFAKQEKLPLPPLLSIKEGTAISDDIGRKIIEDVESLLGIRLQQD